MEINQIIREEVERILQELIDSGDVYIAADKEEESNNNYSLEFAYETTPGDLRFVRELLENNEINEEETEEDYNRILNQEVTNEQIMEDFIFESDELGADTTINPTQIKEHIENLTELARHLGQNDMTIYVGDYEFHYEKVEGYNEPGDKVVQEDLESVRVKYVPKTIEYSVNDGKFYFM